MSEISVKSGFPVGRGNRLSDPCVEFQAGLHFSASTLNREVPIQASEIVSHSNSSNSSLAEETLVHNPTTAQPATTTASPGNIRPPIPGSIPTPSTREITLDSMEIERTLLLEQGCSQEVISTLLQARKSTTNKTYSQVWNRFCSLAQQKNWNPVSPEPPQVLEFLQLGIKKGFSSSTLKVHVSALSAKTGIIWALHPLVIQFMKACLKIRPPRKPTFPALDLSTVLDALSKPPFFPVESISLWNLTLKLTFLITITSVRKKSFRT